jgi:hypothetical protein
MTKQRQAIIVGYALLTFGCGNSSQRGPETEAEQPVAVARAALSAPAPASTNFVSDGVSGIEAQPLATQKAYYLARAQSARQALETERAALSELDRRVSATTDQTQKTDLQRQADGLRALASARAARIAEWDAKAQ